MMCPNMSTFYWNTEFRGRAPPVLALYSPERSMAQTKVIDSFTGRFSALSLIYRSGFFFEGDEYQSAAAAFEAAKIANRPDRVSFIGWNCKPWNARKMGKGIPAYWVRPDWTDIEVQEAVMLEIQRSKFSWPLLHDVLLSTGDSPIIYANVAHDNLWGVCHCNTAPVATRKYGVGVRCAGTGENRIGEILMQVRHEFRCSSLSIADYQLHSRAEATLSPIL